MHQICYEISVTVCCAHPSDILNKIYDQHASFLSPSAG